MEIIVVKHPLDGLRLALGYNQEVPPQRVLLVGQSLVGAELISQDMIGPGPTGSRSASWAQTTVTLLDPFQGPYAGLLDELRHRPTRAVLLYCRLQDDLPPLTGDDSVACFWEMRDALEDSTAHQLAWLGDKISGSGATNRGITLYTRRPLDPDSKSSRWQTLRQALGQQLAGSAIELQPLEVSA